MKRDDSEYVQLPKKATKATSFSDIKKAKRLFYRELQNYSSPTGRWIEINDINRFVEEQEEQIKLKIKYNCSHQECLDHHNFHVILK